MVEIFSFTDSNITDEYYSDEYFFYQPFLPSFNQAPSNTAKILFSIAIVCFYLDMHIVLVIMPLSTYQHFTSASSRHSIIDL